MKPTAPIVLRRRLTVLAGFTLGCLFTPLHAADLETPSVFRPLVRENPVFGTPTTSLAAEPADSASAKLPGGENLRAWLEGSPVATLRVQHGTRPAEILDSAAWPGVPPALSVFPDGTVLLAYRSRTRTGTTEVMLARLVDGVWQKPRVLSTDSWKPEGDIRHAGPRIARSGARAVIAWFSAGNNEPQVLSMASTDAGDQFVQAERIDVGFPTGDVDVVMLHDGARLVSWIERRGDDDSQPGGLYLRRTTAYGSTMAPALLVPGPRLAAGSHPRMALVKDYTDTPAQLAVNFAAEDRAAAPAPLLVTLPEADVLLTADQGCGCTPTAAEQSGVTIRAGLVSVAADRKTIRLRHGGIPGLIKAGTTEFAVGPDVPADVRAGLEVLAHLDEVNGTWTLLDYRVLVMPAGGGWGR